ncbi:MAG: hypothetical protein ACKO2P_11185, partial [Planctomycetota bacterium]
MSLAKWLRECSHRWSSERQRAAVSRLRRKRSKAVSNTCIVRSNPELLEDRVLPATISWAGDVNTSWSTNVDANTNWSDNTLPTDADTLWFTNTTTGSLNNDTTPGNSYSLSFASGGYTINGTPDEMLAEGGVVVEGSGGGVGEPQGVCIGRQ